METPRNNATKSNTENGRKRKRNAAVLENEPPEKKPDTSLYFGFLCVGRKALQALPVDLIAIIAAVVRSNRRVLRDRYSMARALGRSASASALLEGTLRSFQEKPLFLGKRDNSRGGAPTLLAFARRHPDQFQRGSWKGEYRLITIKAETWQTKQA